MERIDEILYYSILLIGILFGVFIAVKFGDIAVEKFKKYL